MSNTNKTVLITGAAQGIGAAIALRFAKEGYQVAINCRNKDSQHANGNAVAEQCRALGAKAQCFVADVSDFHACQQMVKEVREHFSTIDVLVNNAGITKDGFLVRMSEDAFDTVLDVNLKSVFNMTRHVAPLMMRARQGWIINLSSVAGLHGNPGQLNYSASKAGIVGMTKTTAKELGSRGIICNAIAPGFIETSMTEELPEELKEQMLAAISLGRFGKPEDVAELAFFLATTTYVTGQVIEVDGCIAM